MWLVYLRARYYQPSMGRFTQIDPFDGALSVPSSLNGYGYGHGNPARYTDPEGLCGPLCWVTIAAIGALALGGLAYGAQVSANMNQGMDFWNAASYKNINWWIVGGAAAAGAVLAPAAFACITSGGWCAFAWEVVDFYDDVATIIAAGQGDPEAQPQAFAMMVLMLYPDLPVNFLLSKADDIAGAAKYADDLSDIRTLMKVDESHVDYRRIKAMQANLDDALGGQLSPYVLRRFTEDRRKVWTITHYSVDDVPRQSVWAISGHSGGATDLVEDVVEGMGVRVARNVDNPRFITEAPIDAEKKTIELLSREFDDLRPGQQVRIDLFTVRHPCGACGGFRQTFRPGTGRLPIEEIRVHAGYEGLFGDFVESLWNRGISTEINIRYIIDPPSPGG